MSGKVVTEIHRFSIGVIGGIRAVIDWKIQCNIFEYFYDIFIAKNASSITVKGNSVLARFLFRA